MPRKPGLQAASAPLSWDHLLWEVLLEGLIHPGAVHPGRVGRLTGRGRWSGQLSQGRDCGLLPLPGGSGGADTGPELSGAGPQQAAWRSVRKSALPGAHRATTGWMSSWPGGNLCPPPRPKRHPLPPEGRGAGKAGVRPSLAGCCVAPISRSTLLPAPPPRTRHAPRGSRAELV